jgi:hypothetical protein
MQPEQGFSAEIPYSAEQGIKCGEQGIEFGKQGNNRNDQGYQPGVVE